MSRPAALVQIRSLGAARLGLIAAALLAIAVLFLRLSPPLDLAVFLRASHAVWRELPVYPNPSSPAVYTGGSFVYPYLTVAPFLALGRMPTDLAVGLFFVTSALAVAGASLVASDWDARTAVLVLLTAFTITGLQLGALSPLLFAGVVALWRIRDRPAMFGLLAAAVVGSKLFLIPMLVWPLIVGRHRAFAWAAACTLAVLAASFMIGPIAPGAYAHLLSELAGHEARSGFGLTSALIKDGIAPALAELAAGLAAAAVVSVTALRYRRTRDESIAYSGALVAALIATPVLWSHYLILLAAPLLVCGAGRAWFWLLALASWLIAPPHGLEVPLISGRTWAAVAAVLAVGAWSVLRG